MKIAISIPVHEAPDVIVDQAQNIFALTRDCCLVLHVSANNPPLMDRLASDLSDSIRAGRVFLNPLRIATGGFNVLELHMENFFHLERLGHPFEWFCLEASNDMLIRPGLDEHIARHDAGLRVLEFDLAKNDWHMPMARGDRQLMDLLKAHGWPLDRVVGTQVEGTFYRRDLLAEALRVIQAEYRDFHAADYCKEELLLPTVFCRLHDPAKLRLTRSYVFAPWGRRPSLWKMLTTRKRRDYDVTVDDLERILAGKHPMIGNPAAIYGVKRVPRVIDAPTRRYINQLVRRNMSKP